MGEHVMVGESMNDRSDGVLTRERPPAVSHPDRQVDEQRRRRRAAEAAADAAEAAAADAAARASAAIAAAARAAAEAEATADVAARTADAAEAAAAAERHAVARAHAASAVTANETTAVGMAPIAGDAPAGNAPGVRTNGARHQVRDTPLVPGPVPAQDEETVIGAMAVAPIDGPPAGAPPAPGGRAARRRAQEAAAAVAREATRDPDTHVIALDEEDVPDGPAGALLRRSRRAQARKSPGVRVRSLVGRLRNRPGGRVVLAAAAVGAVILVAAVVAGLVNGSRGPSNAAVLEAAPASAGAPATAAAPATRPGGSADQTTSKAAAYLAALRSAGVPTSRSGQAETEAADVMCQRIANGFDLDALARILPAALPDLNSKQAKTVVSITQKKYCA